MALIHPVASSQHLAMLWQAWGRRVTLEAHSVGVILALVAHSGVHGDGTRLQNGCFTHLQRGPADRW